MKRTRSTIVVALCAAGVLAPLAASAQGTAAELLAELASGDGSRCMDAGNATSEHQEHYQTMAAELAPALVRMVEEGAPCAGSALTALVNLGPGIAAGAPAERAVPVLVGILEREVALDTTQDATSAILVVGNYGAGAAAAVPILERFVRERPSYHERSYAILALGEIGDPAAPAVPALLELVVPVSPDDAEAWQKESLRRDVLAALAYMPAAIDRSGPRLAATLAGEDSSLASAAHDALVAVGAGSVPHVVALLAEPGEDGRERALRVLEELGAKAVAATPAVLPVLADDDANLRYRARDVLIAIGPTPEVVAGLVRHVEGRDVQAAVFAAETLGELGPAAKAALPALRAMASRKSWELEMAAQSAIERIAAGG